MTKIINETEPLSSGDSEFAGIWYPTLTSSKHEMFLDADRYVTSANLSSTTLTLVIGETSHYIKNVQSPIAKQPEVIFRTLLFSFLCLEMCAMGFLIVKLIIKPVVLVIHRIVCRRDQAEVEPEYMTKINHHH